MQRGHGQRASALSVGFAREVARSLGARLGSSHPARSGVSVGACVVVVEDRPNVRRQDAALGNRVKSEIFSKPQKTAQNIDRRPPTMPMICLF
jgi:hypothetical protein